MCEDLIGEKYAYYRYIRGSSKPLVLRIPGSQVRHRYNRVYLLEAEEVLE